ncbi:hypothetical protein HMPREF9209_1275 [Lactobacillus gasseri 224-1]|uniref:Uncharacterized protein n=1 Tax=Lactobacillus gasseri 224-1 TaxID=679196 RepID=D1YG79_LACGS|nr:hypothetical protein HMPREF9209_1275 [Lactobacillus gasseri 224-1]
MDETMIEINAVIDQLASKLIQKDEFDYDIKDALISMLEAKENYSLALKKPKLENNLVLVSQD